MAGIDSLQNGLSGLKTTIGEAVEYVKEHPVGVAIAAGVTTAVGGGLVALGTIAGRRKTKRKSKKGRRRDWRFISKQKHEKAYQKRRKKLGRKTYGRKYKTKTSKRRGKVYYARKTGQPYILLKSGRARFIKGKRRTR